MLNLKQIASGLALSLAAPAVFGQMNLGDTLVIQFNSSVGSANAADTEGTWNEINLGSFQPTSSTTLDANLETYLDNRSTGVAFTYTPGSGADPRIGNGDFPVPTNSLGDFPVTGTIPAIAQARTFFIQDTATFTLTNLDENLVYNLAIQSFFEPSSERVVSDYVVNGGEPSSITLSIDPNFTAEPYLFPNLTPASGGSITIEVQVPPSMGAGGPEFSHINALELTAVPEPQALALLVGCLSLGVTVMRRRVR